jgi:hypothetical protein
MHSDKRKPQSEKRKLQWLGKSVSCDNIKATSCIELADIRKLDSLLNQCESISCDNLLLFDDVYNYDLCRTNRRKYASTSAINKILPKNSIRRRAHKKILGIHESDSKIIKFLDDVRKRSGGVEMEAEIIEANTEQCLCDKTNVKASHKVIYCCDKNVQTSQFNLSTATASNASNKSESVTDANASKKCLCLNDESKHVFDSHERVSRKKERRKQCSCRDYKNVTIANAICETSLSKAATSASRPATKRINSKDMDENEKIMSGKLNRLMKQKNTIIDDDENGSAICDVEIFVGVEGGSAAAKKNGSNVNGCHENRVININKSVEIIPISLNSPYCSRPSTPPHLGTSSSFHHDAKSDKSETQSQKSKRSKFSPSFISRKLTSRLNSSELEDGGAKESLLGRAKSTEKKLPDPVETVCICDAELWLSSLCLYFQLC